MVLQFCLSRSRIANVEALVAVTKAGSRKGIRPEIQESSLHEGLWAVVYTDGLTHAGDRKGQPLDVVSL